MQDLKSEQTGQAQASGLIQGEFHYQFEDFLRSGVVAAFSNRKLDLGFRAGIPEQIKKNRKIFLDTLSINYEELVCCQQPHGAGVGIVNRHDMGRGAYDFETAVCYCDALISSCRNLALAVFCADCLPVFLYSAKNNAVAVIHAGWQGTKEKVTRNTVEAMIGNFNVDPAELLVGFGPAIRSCCYEVKEEFRDYFSHGLLERDGRIYLDLIAENKAQLKNLGVAENQIIDSGFCTVCKNEEFFSYRREGANAGRMMSVVMLKGKTVLIKKYSVEFLLNSRLTDPVAIRVALGELGDNLEITEDTARNQKAYRIKIVSQDPTLVFDVSSQFGRIGFVKVEEAQ